MVTADHGVSFKKGQFDRRNVNRGNIDEITPVPLFIKEPGQKRGPVDDSIVETTDIAPTIADVLEHRAARGRRRPVRLQRRGAAPD